MGLASSQIHFVSNSRSLKGGLLLLTVICELCFLIHHPSSQLPELHTCHVSQCCHYIHFNSFCEDIICAAARGPLQTSTEVLLLHMKNAASLTERLVLTALPVWNTHTAPSGAYVEPVTVNSFKTQWSFPAWSMMNIWKRRFIEKHQLWRFVESLPLDSPTQRLFETDTSRWQHSTIHVKDTEQDAIKTWTKTDTGHFEGKDTLMST